MSIRVALHHHTSYQYDRPIQAGPQVIRLRPAPHCRTPIESYSLRISPNEHFINWQQDPHGNFLARIVFENKIKHFTVDVDLVANLSVINPFDFFVEDEAEKHPFHYQSHELEELKPFLATDVPGPLLTDFMSTIDHHHERTIDFLVAVNQRLEQHIDYVVRMEPGVQTCEETLEKRSGSCRDSAWLLVQMLRQLGLAARFTSGYLIQLKPDVESLDGPSGSSVDFTDLHAWAEVFLPGAGWVGLDPTSGLLTGEGHLPLASTPKFSSAAAISGEIEECGSEFDFGMTVTRIHEDPRVTKPYSDEQWEEIDAFGSEVESSLQASGVRLTMGGEPTFVGVDNPESPEWQTDAIGEEKNCLANELMTRMKARFASQPLLHYGQGKWYPGEPVPRWSKTCYWRKDGISLWEHQDLLAEQASDHGHTADDARVFAIGIAKRLGVAVDNVDPAFEDLIYHIWEEQRLPVNVDLSQQSFRDSADRKRLARVLERGLQNPVGFVLPIMYERHSTIPKWVSGKWQTRTERIDLIPGDSPIGYRLPLNSLVTIGKQQQQLYSPLNPIIEREPLPESAALRFWQRFGDEMLGLNQTANSADAKMEQQLGREKLQRASTSTAVLDSPSQDVEQREVDRSSNEQAANSEAIPFALCTEVRNGTVHVFMPPTDRLEQYLQVLAAVEDTAVEMAKPVVIEGYRPPADHRLQSFSITPDPGVLEVNIQPASTWEELKSITAGVYSDAFQSRLGTEKFDNDGTHTGTGGGNHVVLGGATPADSPLLRRPDLLSSLIGFWQNHPSLSYLFSGQFIGPTSQAPRVDEGRADTLYELQIAFDELRHQVARSRRCPIWLSDRLFRNLLVDITGNTHRAEFCIDKLYSPDSSTGRLGLLEFRGFEMPPHERMSLTQQLLLRTLVAWFWNEPYDQPLVDWKTRLHDQFMLPHFVWRDFSDVTLKCQAAGFNLKSDWFKPHFEFRFPFIGGFTHNSVKVELRSAIEPWHVLGEEATGTGTARYVDSSVERMEVKVSGYVDERYVLACNGNALPLHPTETRGQYVAGVRYRAWQPPSCLHPTIPVNGPLTFALYDNWLGRSVDGCRYHIGHPGGLNPASLPVNSFEAESRRAARFSRVGNHGDRRRPRTATMNRDFPMTLDLRKTRH